MDTVASPRGKNKETNYRRYYRYHRYFKSKIPVYCRFFKPTWTITTHYSLGLRQCPEDCGRGTRIRIFSVDADDPRIKASFSAYKLAKLWQNVSRRETDHATAPRAACASAVHVQCMSLARTHFSTDPTLAEFLRTRSLEIRTPLIHAHEARVL